MDTFARGSLMLKSAGLAIVSALLVSVVPQKTAAQSGPVGDMSQIQHVIYIIKENRTFDSYFGTFPGANGATTGKISTGQIIPLGHLADQMPRDITGHGWFDAI